MPTLAVNDLEIGYEVHGAGPPLILLHGATSAGREDFAAQLPLLSQAFQAFVPVDHAWGLARQLPDGRLFVVPGCGHVVTVRRPGLFNDALGAFYRETEQIARRRAEGATAGTEEDAGSLATADHPPPAAAATWLDEARR
jgi:pimeloyl-ACP methyl ester carboxylesterase